jgi:hypothetical protein
MVSLLKGSFNLLNKLSLKESTHILGDMSGNKVRVKQSKSFLDKKMNIEFSNGTKLVMHNTEEKARGGEKSIFFAENLQTGQPLVFALNFIRSNAGMDKVLQEVSEETETVKDIPSSQYIDRFIPGLTVIIDEPGILEKGVGRVKKRSECDLKSHLSNRNTAQTLKFLGESSLGLDVVHNSNKVHGDFKPENVLIQNLGDDKIAVLTDFGGTGSIGDHVEGGSPWLWKDKVRPEKLHPIQDLFALGVSTIAIARASISRMGNEPEKKFLGKVEDLGKKCADSNAKQPLTAALAANEFFLLQQEAEQNDFTGNKQDYDFGEYVQKGIFDHQGLPYNVRLIGQ